MSASPNKRSTISERSRIMWILALACALLLAPPLADAGFAQDPSETDSEIRRTAWGKPDLSGFFDYGTQTPPGRPPELADQAFFTEEEAAAFLERAANAAGGGDSDNSADEDVDSAEDSKTEAPSADAAAAADPPDSAPARPMIPNAVEGAGTGAGAEWLDTGSGPDWAVGSGAGVRGRRTIDDGSGRTTARHPACPGRSCLHPVHPRYDSSDL